MAGASPVSLLSPPLAISSLIHMSFHPPLRETLTPAMWFVIATFHLLLPNFVALGFVQPINRVPSYGGGRKTTLLGSTKESGEVTEDETKSKNKDGDIPAWLKQLIRRDPKSLDTIDIEFNDSDEKLFDSFPFSIGGRPKKSKIWEEELSPVVASLSGMVNVEALLTAANVTAANITSNIGPDEDVNENGLSRTDTIADALSFLDGSLRWEKFMQNVQKKNATKDSAAETLSTDNVATRDLELDELNESIVEAGKSSSEVDKILGEATKRLEFAVNSVSSTFSPSAIQDLVFKASRTLALREASGNLTLAAKIVFDEASKAPRATAKYTAELIEFANATLAGGMKPLFKNYASVKSIPDEEWMQIIKKGAEYGAISGAIYENTVPNTLGLAHSIVAQGKTSDVGWMVTDSLQQTSDYDGILQDEPVMVRSIVLRGFDASDEEVDREALLNNICTATPVPLGNSTILVHEGLFNIAESIYEEVERFIDLTAPAHKFVFAGHSVGGSLSVLLMAILAQRKSTLFVRERLLRVFTFGSPPTFSTIGRTSNSIELCPVLETLELPQDLVHGYSQPWDPVPRLFTEYDPLYPLIDDLGEDGVTPWVSGPTRTLRPITKAILEAWEGWPRFRDNAREKMGSNLNYRSVGKQFLLLPDPTRFITDRLVSVNIPVPSIDSIIQISPQELLPALNEVFLLDTFSISIVPVAIRSFVHHFYPAYLDVFAEHALKSDPDRKTLVEEEMTANNKRRKSEL